MLAISPNPLVNLAVAVNVLAGITGSASGGFDSLPHNGAVITLLAICGLTHRQSYKDVGFVSVIVPVFATIVVIILGTLFGGF